jgi:hypothetical protein
MSAADIASYQGHGLLVAIGYSVGDGTCCFVGHPGSEPAAYQEWPSLWEVTGMTQLGWEWAGRLSSPLPQRRKASQKLHHSKARIAALMLAPQNQ